MEDSIRVGEEDSGTSAFNQAYDKFQGKSGKGSNKVAPGVVTMESSWSNKPVADHRNHLYSHPKHS